jgi:hypothetical protein
MLDSVEDCVGSLRRARLFAIACCRRVWDLFQVEEIRRIVELSEAYADGKISATEVEAANDPAIFKLINDQLYCRLEPRVSIRTGRAMLSVQEFAPATFTVRWASFIATETSLDPERDYFREPDWEGVTAGLFRSDAEQAEQVKLLRDIFGNPFCPVQFRPEWRTACAVSVAQSIYDDRQLPSGLFDNQRMAVLADVLEESGCDNQDVLDHLRHEEKHVRGCWVIDLVRSVD